MPLLNTPYRPPFFFKNAHLHTIWANLFRQEKKIRYKRMRIKTPDYDFIDLDFSEQNSNSIVVIVHGLEGSAESGYMKGFTAAVNRASLSAVCVNLRGCSGEDNLLLSSYHSGKSDDLQHVLNYLESNYPYQHILLVGFSLGGNLLLKYLGENEKSVSSKVKAAAAVSVPCDLKASALQLGRLSNKIYQGRFIRSLKKKILHKKELFPEAGFSIENIRCVKNFQDFDDLYTAPVHGYINAEDYWQQCSSKKYLRGITLPTLLINAQDDPFLAPECYPYAEAKENSFFFLETPEYGGHVGFATDHLLNKPFWHEEQVLKFFLENIE